MRTSNLITRNTVSSVASSGRGKPKGEVKGCAWGKMNRGPESRVGAKCDHQEKRERTPEFSATFFLPTQRSHA